MQSRREFLGALAAPAVAAVPARLNPAGLERVLSVFAALDDRSPAEVARDEAAWFSVQQAFTVDRSQINLNNGGVSPSPAIVQQAQKRHLDFSNAGPATNMWQVLEPQRETVRQGLAELFGCDTEEVALTRNASESLQICQLGVDLEPGDEVLTTNQDYPRMVTTFKQRERREGIVLRQFSIPTPAEDDDEIVRLFESHLTERTRLILMCHVINLTGQILPVAKVVAMARRRGIPVIVDGAHALAHFEFERDELDCDYYGASLHKWLTAPHGTGLLYVRRDRIKGLWPMMAAAERQDEDIRKFEEIGTHPAAGYLAIAEALAFHHGIGGARKAARLRYLRDYWAERLLESDRVHLNTSLDPRFSCGIANVRVDGVETGALGRHLWQQYRIRTTGIEHDEFDGLRISPNVYTTLEELDRFCEAVERVLRDGLPE